VQKKKMAMSRRAPKVEIVHPVPTESAAIGVILTELSTRARVLDAIRNSLVCMSCFKLANNSHVEWKTGDLLCSHCSAEKYHAVDMKTAKVAEAANVRHAAGVDAAGAAEAADVTSGHEEEGDDEDGDEDEGGEDGEDGEGDKRTATPPKDVISHPRLRALEAVFAKQKMYAAIDSSLAVASPIDARARRRSGKYGKDEREGENNKVHIKTSRGGPLDKVRELSHILKHGFAHMKPPPPVAEAEKPVKEKHSSR
jgi:hypothetical protein